MTLSTLVRINQVVIVINGISICVNAWQMWRLKRVRVFYVQMIAGIRRPHEGEDDVSHTQA